MAAAKPARSAEPTTASALTTGPSPPNSHARRPATKTPATTPYAVVSARACCLAAASWKTAPEAAISTPWFDSISANRRPMREVSPQAPLSSKPAGSTVANMTGAWGSPSSRVSQ
ncbi:MAG: hypothetical protein M5U09_23330 [Gammaproteobacteria bacterium]|nr:hypothetical protein [Gammaproteobacteria bacterium]